ncbi:hypothetical protein ACWF94_04430 [Streptomyces sp. NPDC055078]
MTRITPDGIEAPAPVAVLGTGGGDVEVLGPRRERPLRERPLRERALRERALRERALPERPPREGV